MTKPATIHLERMRGDTFPMQFSLNQSDGSALPITGFTFLLTVDPSEGPDNADSNLFQLTGTIVDGPGGVVSFAPSAIESNQLPGEYYYDIQMIDASLAVRTVAKGKFTFLQDITK